MGGAATDTAGCDVRTYDAVALGDYYMYGTAREFWQEANGVPGLQRQAAPCIGHAPIPADTCLTHQENGAIVGCALGFGSSFAP